MSIKFDSLIRSKLRVLKVGKAITEHGIKAERLASGDLRWSINIMVDNQRIHRVIGRESEGVTRTEAERAIEALRTKAREDRLDLPTARKARITFAEASERYLDHMEEAGGKNLAVKKRHLQGRLKAHFGDFKIDSIETADVDRYAASRRLGGAAEATLNRELSTLSHMLRNCEEMGWSKPGACPRIRKRDEPRKKIVVLDHAQSDKLMRAALNDPDDRLALFIAFGLNTAMRHSEILRVKIEHVDFENNRLFIPAAKAGEREQPITNSLCQLLKAEQDFACENRGWLFPSRKVDPKHKHRHSMAKSFQRAVIAAGLCPRQVTPHVMRHTAITRLVKAKHDLPTIQRISGHKTMSMVLRYAHIHGTHIDSAIASIDQPLPVSTTPKLHTA